MAKANFLGFTRPPTHSSRSTATSENYSHLQTNNYVMARPVYETAEDQTREQKVMRRVADAIPAIMSYHKIENISYGTDFLVETKTGYRVLEVKCRKKKIPFWLIAMKKLLSATTWEAAGIPAYLCVHWAEDDSIYLARPFGEKATPFTVEWNGRTKQGRGDKSDMEPHARFQLGDMKKL